MNKFTDRIEFDETKIVQNGECVTLVLSGDINLNFTLNNDFLNKTLDGFMSNEDIKVVSFPTIEDERTNSLALVQMVRNEKGEMSFKIVGLSKGITINESIEFFMKKSITSDDEILNNLKKNFIEKYIDPIDNISSMLDLYREFDTSNTSQTSTEEKTEYENFSGLDISDLLKNIETFLSRCDGKDLKTNKTIDKLMSQFGLKSKLDLIKFYNRFNKSTKSEKDSSKIDDVIDILKDDLSKLKPEDAFNFLTNLIKKREQ